MIEECILECSGNLWFSYVTNQGGHGRETQLRSSNLDNCLGYSTQDKNSYVIKVHRQHRSSPRSPKHSLLPGAGTHSQKKIIKITLTRFCNVQQNFWRPQSLSSAFAMKETLLSKAEIGHALVEHVDRCCCLHLRRLAMCLQTVHHSS